MIKFLPVLVDGNSQNFENQQYFPFVLDLFFKYKNILVDDYYPKDNVDLILYLIDEINSLYPWFLVCLFNDEPLGVVWASRWHGDGKKYHSCQIQSFIDKKFWGKPLKLATEKFLEILFSDLGLKRVQMEIPADNLRAIAFAKRTGFLKEGVIRCATMKNAKPSDHVLFSKLCD